MIPRTMAVDSRREIGRSVFLALDWVSGVAFDIAWPLSVLAVCDWYYFRRMGMDGFAMVAAFYGVAVAARLGQGALAKVLPDVDESDD